MFFPMRHSSLAVALAASALLFSCRKPATEHAPPASAPPEISASLPGTDVRPLTPARREALGELGQQVAAQLTAGQFDATARQLDLESMLAAAFAGIDWEVQPKWKEFRDSLARRLRAEPAQLFANLHGARATFLRLHETPSGTSALVRCVLPNGAATYFEVYPRFDDNGAARLGNIYNHATGLDVPDSLRAILFALAPSADRSLAQRLFGGENAVDPALLEELDSALRQRRPAAVAAAWKKLPTGLRLQRPVFMSVLQVLMAEPQSPEYLAALEEARAQYADDPLADLLSIDLFFLKKDIPALEACLDRIEQRMGGPDAHLATLRASGRLAADDLTGAEQAIDQALSLEPGFANATYTRLKLLILRRDFIAACALLDAHKERTGERLAPPPAERGDAFAAFLHSPEYTRWSAANPPTVDEKHPPASAPAPGLEN